MSVTRHRSIHVVTRTSTLIESHMDLLIVLTFVSTIASRALLHVGGCVSGDVCVVRESASKLRLVTVALASAASVLALLIRLILSV